MIFSEPLEDNILFLPYMWQKQCSLQVLRLSHLLSKMVLLSRQHKLLLYLGRQYSSHHICNLQQPCHIHLHVYQKQSAQQRGKNLLYTKNSMKYSVIMNKRLIIGLKNEFEENVYVHNKQQYRHRTLQRLQQVYPFFHKRVFPKLPYICHLLHICTAHSHNGWMSQCNLNSRYTVNANLKLEILKVEQN